MENFINVSNLKGEKAMPRLKFEFSFQKVAYLKTPAGAMKIGEVEEFRRVEEPWALSGKVEVMVRFLPNLDQKIIDAIAKNPEAMTIGEEPSKPYDIKLLPDIQLPLED